MNQKVKINTPFEQLCEGVVKKFYFQQIFFVWLKFFPSLSLVGVVYECTQPHCYGGSGIPTTGLQQHYVIIWGNKTAGVDIRLFTCVLLYRAGRYGFRHCSILIEWAEWDIKIIERRGCFIFILLNDQSPRSACVGCLKELLQNKWIWKCYCFIDKFGLTRRLYCTYIFKFYSAFLNTIIKFYGNPKYELLNNTHEHTKQ